MVNPGGIMQQQSQQGQAQGPGGQNPAGGGPQNSGAGGGPQQQQMQQQPQQGQQPGQSQPGQQNNSAMGQPSQQQQVTPFICTLAVFFPTRNECIFCFSIYFLPCSD